MSYMSSSIPLVEDFNHAAFQRFCDRSGIKHGYHRKLWEFAYIAEMLERRGVLGPGSRGLCFGSGTEPLPALFASIGCEIVATDAPPEITDGLWHEKGEHADGAGQLFKADIIERSVFDSQVSFEYADMNNIPEHLTGFDFCWSACALEHLGSLRKGIDFIINSIEKTLKPGGIACHTTEFNLSSDDKTIEREGISLYRHRDLLALVSELRMRGHTVDRVIIAAGAEPIDKVIDVPPYGNQAHLKLLLEDYIVTSIGITIKRGPV